MTDGRLDGSASRKPLRLWPGVVLVVLLVLARFGTPLIAPDVGVYGLFAALAAAVLIVVWWVFFSRAPWVERLGALVVIAAVMAATPLVLHESIATGAMGFLFYMYAVPTVCLALVAWAVLTRNLPAAPRRWALVAAVVLACGGWALVRTGGFRRNGNSRRARV